MLSLEQAKADVDAELGLKLKTGKCSELMRHQLAEGYRRRTIRLSAVLDEIGQMEGSDPPRSTGTKPAAPFKHKILRGLWHKHYKEPSYESLARNLNNHWQREENQEQRAEIENEYSRDGHAGKLAHQVVLGAHEGRHSANQITGEWIVYAEIAGVNYYLTLGTHKERDEVTRELVRSCFAEFPELSTHLGW